MAHWHNKSGQPLSSLPWLEAHHRAKRRERTAFAVELLKSSPQTIVDLGCGPGIWLELLNKLAPPECRLVGIDLDPEAVEIAKRRSASWERESAFFCLDLNAADVVLPEADFFLAFNIFPYLTNPSTFMRAVRAALRPNGRLVVRQYDGALLRFGPLNSGRRLTLDSSLHASLRGSQQFRHYDLDRVYDALEHSPFSAKLFTFESFQRFSPFPSEFIDYLKNSIEWMEGLVNEDASSELRLWLAQRLSDTPSMPSYFVELDLVAWLS